VAEPFFSAERPTPIPTDWDVQCPACGENISCEMEQEVDGSFSKADRDGDPVVNCECGCFFIPANVTVRITA
jgi:hypothetical protein